MFHLVILRLSLRCLTAGLMLLFATPLALGQVAAGEAADGELPRLLEARVVSTSDGEPQPVRYWVPDSAKTQPTPVLVSLHTWSGDYTQDRSAWQQEAVRRGWIYVQPNFRGRNDHPEACGSALARQDVLDSLDWAIGKFKADTARIYLAGTSGGGHMSLLMAARHPERFSAVSAWVGISDLADWYRFQSPEGKPANYARMVAASCGGPPGASEEVDRQYRERSPIYFLQNAVGLPLDISAGVKDGKTGSVPIHHSLRAFNVVAKAGGDKVIPETTMDELWEQGRLSSPQPSDEADDPTYGRAILLRRSAGTARVTIFDGGHEDLPRAACDWLAKQSRPTDRAAASNRSNR